MRGGGWWPGLGAASREHVPSRHGLGGHGSASRGRAAPDALRASAERRRAVVKSGLVAVAGRPNVGKSTLVNALCGEKVAITSTVPNTTRRRIFGVVNGDDWQLVLVDLPGLPAADGRAHGADAGDGRRLVRGRRRRPPRRLGARPDRCRRSLRRAPRVLARRPRDHRGQQDRPAQARPRCVTDEGGGEARRLPRAPSGEREDRATGSASSATISCSSSRMARHCFPGSSAPT